MNAEWFFSDGDARQGPVTEDELKRLLAGGRVAPTDLVWKDGMPDWVEARAMAGFVPAGDDDRPRPARRSEGREGDRHRDDDDRPRYRRRADEDEGYDRPTRSRRRYEDDEDEDRPHHRRRSSEEVDDDLEDRLRRRSQSGVPADVAGTKMAAGLLAIFLGMFGVHKFYLGYNQAGVVYIAILVAMVILAIFTCGVLFFMIFVPAILGLIEGILYLTKTDREFYQTYMVRQKEWF